MSSSPAESEGAHLPEDLPPVTPPSAGFILQLFVVPGLIVAAIVGIWLIFGMLATGEQDWESLVVELKHQNPHRRWRGALGLAQVLKADQDRASNGKNLAANENLARALSDVLNEELARGSQSEEDLNYQAFLARTLGLFELPDVVAPALRRAMEPGRDREVRKNAVGAVAVMADRLASRGGASADLFVEDLVLVSADEDPLLRRLAAFALGLIPGDATRDRLDVLLGDSDEDTQLNAAIALARQGDTRGAPALARVIERANQAPPAAKSDEYEQFVALKNALAAVEQMAPRLTVEQRKALLPPIEVIASDYREPKIRVTAQSALNALRASGASPN